MFIQNNISEQGAPFAPWLPFQNSFFGKWEGGGVIRQMINKGLRMGGGEGVKKKLFSPGENKLLYAQQGSSDSLSFHY